MLRGVKRRRQPSGWLQVDLESLAESRSAGRAKVEKETLVLDLDGLDGRIWSNVSCSGG